MPVKVKREVPLSQEEKIFTCSSCSQEQLGTDFYWNVKTKDGGFTRDLRCISCIKEAAREYYYRTKNRHSPEEKSERQRKLLYGTTLAEVCEKQGTTLCFLCRVKEANCVDHDHKSGRVRGALCKWCNGLLYYIENDMSWVRRAEQYVEEGGSIHATEVTEA